ncbi:MAG: peptidylprolyl isomerase [Acidobacteriota bacterium]|nr:peptidylprolyl isomerase [Acidobacteriota bacterium]
MRMCQLMTGLVVFSGALAMAQPGRSQSLSSNVPGAVVFERILVKVNGEVISQGDLEEAQVDAFRGRPVPQSEAALRQAVQELTPQLITLTVDNLLLAQRGREMGYDLTDEQFDEIVDGIKVENGFDDEQLAAGLAVDGMTMADLRTVVEEQMLIQQVQQIEVNRRISMTGFEAREYYEANLEEFTPPPTVTLREILIAAPEGGGALDQTARMKAEVVHGRVAGGEDFAGVAAEISDAASKDRGGLVGPIELGDLAEGVRVRVEGLEVGQVSTVERTPAGYHMLQLASRADPEPADFDEIRDSIVDSVFESRRLGALEDYLATLREAAIIEWNDETLRSLFEEYVRTRAAGL